MKKLHSMILLLMLITCRLEAIDNIRLWKKDYQQNGKFADLINRAFTSREFPSIEEDDDKPEDVTRKYPEVSFVIMPSFSIEGEFIQISIPVFDTKNLGGKPISPD